MTSRWAAHIPAEVLSGLYIRSSAAPSKGTVWRRVTGGGAEAAAADEVIRARLLEPADAM